MADNNRFGCGNAGPLPYSAGLVQRGWSRTGNTLLTLKTETSCDVRKLNGAPHRTLPCYNSGRKIRGTQMPIYEYVCEECDTRFERIVINKQQEIACPKCASKKAAIQLSVFAAPNGSANGGSTTRSSSGGGGGCCGGGCGCN